MAYSGPGWDLSFKAYEDLSSYQYHYVALQDDNYARLMDAATDMPVGILQNAPAQYEEAVVRVAGISKLKMNGALAVGAKVKAEYVGAADTGKGDAADTDYDNVVGIVLMATGAEDDVGTVLIVHDTLMVA